MSKTHVGNSRGYLKSRHYKAPIQRPQLWTWQCQRTIFRLKCRPNLRENYQMPWNSNDAERHTRKATTSALKELWAKVANESLERTGDEGRAIREANAVIARQDPE